MFASASHALPPGVGIGLKPPHAGALLAGGHGLDFIEVHAENLMGGGGPTHARVDALRRSLGLSVHGVGLSIGGVDPLDVHHLERLARVVERFEPTLVSEHLAWSSHGGVFFNDLLPVAYDETTLRRVVRHVQQVQDRLRRPVLIENPSTYVAVAGSTMEEVDFLAALVARSGCGLLLDLNNVVVSQHNRGASPGRYVDAFPLHAVGQIHLAGHSVETLDDGSTLRIDDHGSAVGEEAWALYAGLIDQHGCPPTLIEWDTDVPPLEVLLAEAAAARQMQQRVALPVS